jgi:hypothetical protein
LGTGLASLVIGGREFVKLATLSSSENETLTAPFFRSVIVDDGISPEIFWGDGDGDIEVCFNTLFAGLRDRGGGECLSGCIPPTTNWVLEGEEELFRSTLPVVRGRGGGERSRSSAEAGLLRTGFAFGFTFGDWDSDITFGSNVDNRFAFSRRRISAPSSVGGASSFTGEGNAFLGRRRLVLIGSSSYSCSAMFDRSLVKLFTDSA